MQIKPFFFFLPLAYAKPAVNVLGLRTLGAPQRFIHIWLLCKRFMQMNGKCFTANRSRFWLQVFCFDFWVASDVAHILPFAFSVAYETVQGVFYFVIAMIVFHLDCLWPYPNVSKSISGVQWTFTSLKLEWHLPFPSLYVVLGTPEWLYSALPAILIRTLLCEQLATRTTPAFSERKGYFYIWEQQLFTFLVHNFSDEFSLQCAALDYEVQPQGLCQITVKIEAICKIRMSVQTSSRLEPFRAEALICTTHFWISTFGCVTKHKLSQPRAFRSTCLHKAAKQKN